MGSVMGTSKEGITFRFDEEKEIPAASIKELRLTTQCSEAKLLQDALNEIHSQLAAGTYPIKTIEELSKYPIHTQVREVNFLALHNLLMPDTITHYRQTLGIQGMEDRF